MWKKEVCQALIPSQTWHPFPGLTSQSFHGIPHLREVVCSGEDLTSDLAVLSLTLFMRRNNRVLAYVSIKDGVCTTSESYSACAVDAEETRRTRLITLVTDLEYQEARTLGCNITVLRSGISWHASWYLVVEVPSRQSLCTTSYLADNLYLCPYIQAYSYIHTVSILKANRQSNPQSSVSFPSSYHGHNHLPQFESHFRLC